MRAERPSAFVLMHALTHNRANVQFLLRDNSRSPWQPSWCVWHSSLPANSGRLSGEESGGERPALRRQLSHREVLCQTYLLSKSNHKPVNVAAYHGAGIINVGSLWSKTRREWTTESLLDQLCLWCLELELTSDLRENAVRLKLMSTRIIPATLYIFKTHTFEFLILKFAEENTFT